MSEFAAPRGAARAPSSRSPAAERVLAGLAVLAAAAALAAGASLAAPSLFRITRYEVRGASAMAREEVLSAALLRGNERFFSVRPERVRAALEAEPRIAGARVARSFPNGLVLDIVERVPVATVLVESEGFQRLAYLDRQGVAFALAYAPAQAGKGRPAGGYPAPEGLPLLSGLRIENFKPGARLPPELAGVLAAIGGIESSEPALLAAFSEIKVSRSRFGETELLLYPFRGRAPVRVGASPTAAELRSVILVLDVLGPRIAEGSVSEIDFRTGTVVYRGKEGQSD
jgi:hypothetical protein